MKTRSKFTTIFFLVILLQACTPARDSGFTTLSTKPTTAGEETSTPRLNTATPTHTVPPAILPAESPPRGAAAEFSTDFSQHTVPYDEILTGGPPKDGIPTIDKPVFIDVNEANRWLRPREPVILVEVGEAARAYPLQILIWHEIVNDTLGNLPLTVTFCPLCNTAIAFKRNFDGQVLDFGTTGRLRYSNLIMYDRQTETWWQQANGEAIAGYYAGSQLEFYPAVIISWKEFMQAHPDGSVLSKETGYTRAYGQNPYTGYDDIDNPPFLYDGPQTPDVLPPVARVLTVDLKGEAVAYPYETLEEARVVNDTVGGQLIAVFWVGGTVSALDTELIVGGRDVGSAAAYARILDGLELTFEVVDAQILDRETGSTWNVLGQAIAGELTGKQLTPIVAINHFWFSWAAFRPETKVYKP
jgi:hypothetical protein